MGSSLGRLAAAGARGVTKSYAIQREDEQRAAQQMLQQLQVQKAQREEVAAQALEKRRADQERYRMAALRRLDIFKDAPDDELRGRASDDDAFREALRPQRPEPYRAMTREQQMADREEEAGIAARHRPPPQPPQPSFSFPVGSTEEGTPVIMRANTRTGEVSPTGLAGRPTEQGGSVERQKRVQALANVSDALDAFEKNLTATGSTVMPSVESDALTTDYENLQLQLKELYNLGVLNGPDLALMRRIVQDPTSVTGRARALGSSGEQTKRSLAQVQKVREKIAGYKQNLAAGNRAGAPEATEEQQLWDAAVARHGKAKVLAEVGPRPQ